MVSLAVRLFVIAFVLLLVERPTYAYLDPGSGSMLLQVLLGGIAATAVLAKVFWQRILEFFGIRSKDQQ
jgi:hypothetical protein